MLIYKMHGLHFNLSSYIHYKVIIYIQCIQVKCISRLFANNLNDFNTHYLGKLYSTLPVRLWTCSSILVPHFCFIFWGFIVAPKKLKLDFNINAAKWILWVKTIPWTNIQTTEWTTNIESFDAFVRGSPIFT